MKSKDILHSPRVEEMKRAKRQKTIKKIIILSVCFLILVAGLVYLSRLQKMKIDNIVISGTEVLDEKEILSMVNSEISGKYLWLFSRANTFIYPKNTISKKLKDKFKIISELEVTHPEIKKIVVTIKERKGEYLWCLENTEEKSNCYFLNSDGYVFSSAPYFSGNAYFKFIGDATFDDPIGKQFLSPEKFIALLGLKKSMYLLKLNPSGVEIMDNGEYQFILNRSSGRKNNPPKIIIPNNFDFEKIVSNLESVVFVDPLKTELAKGFPTLSYIDMRFDNKVFYK